MGWKDRAEKVGDEAAATPSWKSRAQIVDESLPAGPSEWDSAGRGLVQAGTLGLRDEGAGFIQSPTGGLKTLADLVGDPTGSLQKLQAQYGLEDPDQDIKDYKKERDASRQLDEVAKAANPKSYLAGELGGALATSFIPGLGVSKGAGLLGNIAQAGVQGAGYGLGSSNATNISDLLADTVKGAGIGAVGGGVGYGLSKAAEQGIQAASRGLGSLAGSLGEGAEKLAVKATGATGRQSEKFAEDAGRQLLDRGLVRPFDNAGDIAGRVGAASDEAGNAIGSALKALDEKGVTASSDNVVKQLEQQALKLAKDPSQAGTVRKLRGIIEDIVNTGESAVPLTAAEETKRGFSKAAGNWMDPEAGAAGKKAYLGYMDEVERAATAADPSLAQQFKEGKETYKLLAPIKEASEKRAAQLNQSPFGGFGDFAAGATGSVAGGPGAAATIAARRTIIPRLASTGAVTADALSKIASSVPEKLGKFAGVIQSAAQRGSQGVAATHFILNQTNPEYRDMMKKLQDESANEE